MSRQTSDRLDEISSAILVPLTTTVAFSLSKRTIRPMRASVICECGATTPFDDRGADFDGEPSLSTARFPLRFVLAFAMPRLCGRAHESTNQGQDE